MTLQLGRVYASIGAIAAFAEALTEEPATYLTRHANGDWGEVNKHDRKANEDALEHDLRPADGHRVAPRSAAKPSSTPSSRSNRLPCSNSERSAKISQTTRFSAGTLGVTAAQVEMA